MKNLKLTVIIITVLIIGLFLKDTFLKSTVQNLTRIATGLQLNIRSFRSSIIRSTIDIRGLRLYNPRGFKDRVMLDMPHIYVDFDVAAALKGDIHLRKMRIYLKEFAVERNEEGELNINSLKVVKASEEKGRPSERKEIPIQVDELNLKIDKAVYKDYSVSPGPVITEFEVNLDERYTDIHDLRELVTLIVVRSMRETAIANLANFDLNTLQNTLSKTIFSAEKLAGKAGAVAEGATRKLEEALGGIGDIFK